MVPVILEEALRDPPAVPIPGVGFRVWGNMEEGRNSMEVRERTLNPKA